MLWWLICQSLVRNFYSKSMKYNDVVWQPVDPKKSELETFNLNPIGGYSKFRYGERIKFLNENIFNHLTAREK